MPPLRGEVSPMSPECFYLCLRKDTEIGRCSFGKIGFSCSWPLPEVGRARPLYDHARRSNYPFFTAFRFAPTRLRRLSIGRCRLIVSCNSRSTFACCAGVSIGYNQSRKGWKRLGIVYDGRERSGRVAPSWPGVVEPSPATCHSCPHAPQKHARMVLPPLMTFSNRTNPTFSQRGHGVLSGMCR
jgi:hypothetical protein